jgi:hypothetical protein
VRYVIKKGSGITLKLGRGRSLFHRRPIMLVVTLRENEKVLIGKEITIGRKSGGVRFAWESRHRLTF